MFVFTRFLIIGISHQSRASFLLHWDIFFGGYLFAHTLFFLKQKRFLGFGFPKIIFGFFYLFHIWQTIMPKLWMSGVGTLCAVAHYRASSPCLFMFSYFPLQFLRWNPFTRGVELMHFYMHFKYSVFCEDTHCARDTWVHYGDKWTPNYRLEIL